MPALPALLVITDLDGTLLDHHTYGHAEAEPALSRLQELRVPVVFNSSKTQLEILQIRQALGNQAPYVVENGAALYIPEPPAAPDRELSYGLARSLIQHALQYINQQQTFRFVAFSGMTVEQLMELTGLSPDRARLALDRGWSEPLLWQDTAEALINFTDLAQERGLNVVKGGRFVHVSGHASKASCLQDLREWFMTMHGTAPLVVALGDGANDLPLLQEADIAVQIRSPAFPFPEFSHPHLIRTTLAGPAGWNEAMLTILERTQ